MSSAVGAGVSPRPHVSERRGVRAIAALAAIEGVRLVRHPIFLGGAALTIAGLAAVPMSDPGVGYWGLVGWGLVPLAGATLLVTNLAALRSRRHATDDLYGTLPVGATARTAAILLSVLFAAAAAVALLAAAYVYLDAGSGLEVTWAGQRAVPSARELGQGPATVIVFGVLGVALARWLPNVLVAPLVLFAVLTSEMVVEGTTPINNFVNHRLTWFFAVANPSITPPWSFWPCYQSPANPCDVYRFAVASAGWHLLYLGALAALFATLALMRAQKPGRLLAAIGAPALLVAAAALRQLP